MNFLANCPVLLLLFLLVAFRALAAARAERAYQKAKENYHQLLESSRNKLYRDNWEAVIEGFLAVTKTLIPGIPRPPPPCYMAGKACQGLYRVSRLKDDAGRAVGISIALAAEYPEISLADDALVLAAGSRKMSATILPRPICAIGRWRNDIPPGDMASAGPEEKG